MKNKFMALIAALFAFTYLANGEDFFSVSIKGGLNAWDARKAGYYVTEKDKDTVKDGTNKEYCFDKDWAGFARTNYGITIDALFGLGAGFSTGLGLGLAYETNFATMDYQKYDSKGKEADKPKDSKDTYELNNDAIRSAVRKAADFTITPELVVKYSFVDLDPVSLYAIGRAGLVIPLGMYGNITYAGEVAEDKKEADKSKDAEKAEKKENQTVSRSWNPLNNHLLSLGIGMSWIGIEAEVSFERTARLWSVVHNVAANSYESKANAEKKVVEAVVGKVLDADTNVKETSSTMGVNFKVGYTFGL